MKSICALVSILLLVTHVAVADNCAEARSSYNRCSEREYDEYKSHLKKGEDGRPDFHARKACNYMTDAVEICGTKHLSKCNSEDEVTKEKDKQLARVLQHIKTTVKEWDSNKCPAIKSHEERMKGTDEDSKNEVIPEEKALTGMANIIGSKQAIVLLVILPTLHM